MKDVRPIICIKIGGRAATEEMAMNSLVAEIAAMSAAHAFVIVHGGGAEVTKLSETLGYTSAFRDGIRMTSPEEMDVVDMVLAGKMNKKLVRRFNASGLRAVGLSGSDGRLFTGNRLDEHTHTGKIERVDEELLGLLLERSYLPVVASTSMTESGVALNINADDVALAVAAGMRADVLLFLSDTSGVLTLGGDRIAELDERSVTENIDNGTITGGMIPKVRASVEALRAGVGRIVVGRYSSSGDLESLLSGAIGTRVMLGAE